MKSKCMCCAMRLLPLSPGIMIPCAERRKVHNRGCEDWLPAKGYARNHKGKIRRNIGRSKK